MDTVDKAVMLEALASMYSVTSDKAAYPFTYDSTFAEIAKTQA
jgi:hypothetical protein